jgi:hypothetical protein
MHGFHLPESGAVTERSNFQLTIRKENVFWYLNVCSTFYNNLVMILTSVKLQKYLKLQTIPYPEPWCNTLNTFQKTVLLRCIRPDKVNLNLTKNTSLFCTFFNCKSCSIKQNPSMAAVLSTSRQQNPQ